MQRQENVHPPHRCHWQWLRPWKIRQCRCLICKVEILMFEIKASQKSLKRKSNMFSLSIQIHLMGLRIFTNTFRTLSALLFFSCCTSPSFWQQFQGNHIKYFHFKSTIPQISSTAWHFISCRSHTTVTKPPILKYSYISSSLPLHSIILKISLMSEV